MKKNKNLETIIETLVFSVLLMMLVAGLTWITLNLGGIELLIMGAIFALSVEAVILVSAFTDPQIRHQVVWGGCVFHLLAFLMTWGVCKANEWWGEPFHFEAEQGHCIFVSEVSSASLWYVLAILAAVRVLIVQPIFCIILAKKSRY